MSGSENPRGPEEMSDQVFAQVLLTLNEVAICFADMPPKVSEDLHNVLGRSSDEQTYETELPIDLGTMFPTFSQSKNIKFQSMEIHHTTAEIRSSARQSGSNIKEYGAISTRCMESKQPGHSEPLTKHSNQYLRDPQEDAEPESTHNKYYTVEHQYSAQIEIDPSNRHNVEHQYCAEPQLHTRNYNTAHHYCAEPENQFSNRHHEVEHQYCADPVMHPSNRHQNCTEPESQTSNLSQKYCVDPECQSFKRHLAVEHQYCAELTHEPKCQESLHHDCVQPKTEPTQQEAKHICNAEPDNATAHPKTENEYCSKTEVALGIEEVEHRYSSELDKEEIPLETKHQYCLELDNEQAHCEAVHQYCDQPEMEPNNGHKIMEHNNEAYIVREHKEYSEHAADSHAETASQESPEPKEYIGQFQEKPEEPSELQGKCLKIGLGKGSDNYFEHDNEYVHVQNNQDTVSNTNPNNGFVEKTCKDYTEPELLSHCVVVSCKEEESESRINCIESGECLDAEPEAVHSDGCIAVYHDAYTIVEVGPINGTVGIFHENAKPDFNPSEDYMGSKQEKYAEPSYVPINGYCEDPSGETSNQCLVVYHGQYVEQATEPSHHIQEEDPEEYTLQLELLEAASEVTKDHILKHPEEGELAKNKLEQASCSMDGPDLSIESEQGLIKCTNPTVLWSAIAANKAHTCAECGKAFSRNSNLIIHRRTHTGEKPFKCAECDKSFVSSSKLIAHERTHTEPSPQKNYEQDLEVCVENVRSSQSPSKDQAHSPQWTEQDKTLMGKKKTGRKQKSIAGLEHASNVETGVKNSNSRKKPGRKKGAKKIHICIECGRNFSRLSNLVNHQRTHTGEKPYECSECGKRFSDVANMITHGRVHTGEKPFACGRCGKSFSRLSNMKTHQRMHTGEKPYPCNQCDKRFSHSSHLVTHQQLHTGERPHTCEECGKSFSRLANMLTHQKLHKGEKPYLCNVCFKRFNRSSHLTKHLQMHMREDLLMREDALRMEQQMCIREHIIILQ